MPRKRSPDNSSLSLLRRRGSEPQWQQGRQAALGLPGVWLLFWAHLRHGYVSLAHPADRSGAHHQHSSTLFRSPKRLRIAGSVVARRGR